MIRDISELVYPSNVRQKPASGDRVELEKAKVEAAGGANLRMEVDGRSEKAKV